MIYLDTSFVTPLVLQEPTSVAIEKFVGGLPAGDLAISHWTRVEFTSLLAREVRVGGLDVQSALEADALFETITAETFRLLLPTANDFDRAKQYLRSHKTGLKAGDALHLAIAANNEAVATYTLDKALIAAGKALGLPVKSGIRLSEHR
ncbi:MAG: PIN domain-containing protein [Alphaproteobacteria bacterium]|nr:PIN domain-containing protein [Alphaproteobacteria bacterium]